VKGRLAVPEPGPAHELSVDDIRPLVEERIGGPVSIKELRCAALLHGDSAMWPDTYIKDLSQTIVDLRQAGYRPADDADLGPQWPPVPEAKRRREAKRVLEGFRGEQQAALTILGLDGFIESERIFDVLREIALHDERGIDVGSEDRETLLCYRHRPESPDLPDHCYEPFSLPGRQWRIDYFRGFTQQEAIDAFYGSFAGVGRRLQWSRLHRLSELAQEIVTQTDCLEADAIAFLLSDRTFLLPRARVLREPGGRLTIKVSSDAISAQEVYATYRAAVESLESRAPRLSTAERDKRLLELWTETPDLTWRQRMKRWNDTDGLPPFETAERMTAIAHKARRKAEGGTP